MEIQNQTDSFGALISGIDISSNLNEKQISEIISAINKYKLICIKNQSLNPEKLVNFTRFFGQPKKYFVEDETIDGFPEVIEVTNRNKETNEPKVYASHWHTDDSYRQKPATLTFMYPKILPKDGGGGTDFIDCCAVYDELPDVLKNEITNYQAVHKWQSRRNVSAVNKLNDEQNAATPDAIHPLIRMHPVSGRKSVFINPNRIDHISGLSERDSDTILDELYEFSFQEKFQYKQSYSEGDLVIWDNRNTMHKANSDYDISQLRIMHRVMLEGEEVIAG